MTNVSTGRIGGSMATGESEGRESTLPEDVATTQSLFREVNERIKEVGKQTGSFAYPSEAICECAQAECSELISISKEGYERLRSRPTWFAVFPSDAHVFPEVERVIDRHGGYWIVEKFDQAGALAERFDPRNVDDTTTL